MFFKNGVGTLILKLLGVNCRLAHRNPYIPVSGRSGMREAEEEACVTGFDTLASNTNNTMCSCCEVVRSSEIHQIVFLPEMFHLNIVTRKKTNIECVMFYRDLQRTHCHHEGMGLFYIREKQQGEP